MCINCLNAQKVDVRVELTKKTSHCKSRDFLRKRRLKIAKGVQSVKVFSRIAKGLQSVKVFSSTVPEKLKKLDRIGAPKRRTLSHFFIIHCCKTSKT